MPTGRTCTANRGRFSPVNLSRHLFSRNDGKGCSHVAENHNSALKNGLRLMEIRVKTREWFLVLTSLKKRLVEALDKSLIYSMRLEKSRR
jgi:hypothetical protein